jgi:hypothetical protein
MAFRLRRIAQLDPAGSNGTEDGHEVLCRSERMLRETTSLPTSGAGGLMIDDRSRQRPSSIVRPRPDFVKENRRSRPAAAAPPSRLEQVALIAGRSDHAPASRTREHNESGGRGSVSAAEFGRGRADRRNSIVRPTGHEGCNSLSSEVIGICAALEQGRERFFDRHGS